MSNYLFNVDEKLYEARALLEVVQDGLTNDVVGITNDYYATTIRVAINAVESAQNSMDLNFRQRREEMQRGNYAEDEGEDEVPGWRAKSDLFTGEIVSDEESEDGKAGEERPTRFSAGSLGVTLVKEHEDGSSTFEVNGSKEQMSQLFSAFFTEAITKGIDSTEQQTDRWITEKRLIRKAIELEKALKTWESVDEFDYDPEVLKIRMELTDLIIKYGAVR